MSGIRSRSTSACRAEARTAPSRGACWIGLLEEPWMRFDGISGTSAGAMNAAVMIDGLAEGGPELGARGTRELLESRSPMRP